LVTSDTCKQYDPADSVPESNTALLDWAVVLLPDGTEHVLPLGVPIPIPMTTVGNRTPPGRVSTADVSVRVTVPLCVVVNVLTSLCRLPLIGAGTVPVNVSVSTVAGVVDKVEAVELLQPAAESASGTTRTWRMWRTWRRRLIRAP